MYDVAAGMYDAGADMHGAGAGMCGGVIDSNKPDDSIDQVVRLLLPKMTGTRSRMEIGITVWIVTSRYVKGSERWW
jgi:hypothetical protein